MKALVLAAGRGRGIRPLSDSRPAAVVSAAGIQLISDTLHHLASSGITSVVVNGVVFAPLVTNHHSCRNPCPWVQQERCWKHCTSWMNASW